MSIAGWEDSLGDVVVPGDIVADKYRVDRIIGTGGMGVVVEAWHIHFEERVAIKFLMPQVSADVEAVTRFEREARAAFKIKSQHIARVLDVGKLPNSSPYMVMEYLEGRDLGDLLCDQHTFSVEQSVDFIIQAAEAVGEAHVLGIVHRDLKPENLFVTQRADGNACIKVLDFGLSKVAVKENGGRQRALTGSSQVMGTPQYMSPEQWMSARNVGPAADIWALGTILFELVGGVQPFEQEQLAQLCTLVLTGSPPSLATLRPDAPPGLEEVILRCLAKEPESRWPNIAEFVAALCPYGTHEGLESAKRTVGVFRKSGFEVTTPLALADVSGSYSAQPQPASDLSPATPRLQPPQLQPPQLQPPQLQPEPAQQPLTTTSPLDFYPGAGQQTEPGPVAGSGPQAAVASAPAGQLPQTEADSPQITFSDQPILPAVAPLAPSSSEPAQSWQHKLDQQPAKKGAGKAMLAVIAALVIIGLGVGAISFAAYNDDGPAPASSAPPQASSAPAAAATTGGQPTASVAVSAAAAAAAAASGSGTPGAAPWPKVKPPPAPKTSTAPAVPPTTAPPKPDNQPKGSGSAFAYP